MFNMHRKSIGKNGSSRQRNANIFSISSVTIFHRFCIRPSTSFLIWHNFSSKSLTSPKIKTDGEVMEGVQKQLEKELEEGTGSVYPTPSPRCPPKVSAFVSAFD